MMDGVIRARVSFCIGLVGPRPYQCSTGPYQYPSEPGPNIYRSFNAYIWHSGFAKR